MELCCFDFSSSRTERTANLRSGATTRLWVFWATTNCILKGSACVMPCLLFHASQCSVPCLRDSAERLKPAQYTAQHTTQECREERDVTCSAGLRAAPQGRLTQTPEIGGEEGKGKTEGRSTTERATNYCGKRHSSKVFMVKYFKQCADENLYTKAHRRQMQ